MRNCKRRHPIGYMANSPSISCPSSENVGWRGDSVEAELFAFLAARTVRGLPISFPGTTGAPAPITGGRIVRPG